MKKIDLHLHTVATPSDSSFTFSIDKLKDYVREQEIDCIAITNHNVFNPSQYKQIVEALSIPVLPGIEIDLEGGHLLLIAAPEQADAFEAPCAQVTGLINGGRTDITVTELQQCFGDLSNFLLIPHYEKGPAISAATLTSLSSYTNITAGEVSSVKKFMACSKDPDKLVPVLFSDARFSDQMTTFPTRHTWVNLQEVSFAGIKYCLADRNKIALSKDRGNTLFQATPAGLMLSTGMNVILGERSSGKTYTLDRICETIDHIKYIRQFSLQQSDNDKFERQTSINKSSVSEYYLKEFKAVVEDVNKFDLEKNEHELDNFIKSLVGYAEQYDLQDAFSKAALFTETSFAENSTVSLETLINAVAAIIENSENRPIIEKHLSIESLKRLIVELILKYKDLQVKNAQIKWVNALVQEIKGDLQLKSTSTPPSDVDFFKLALERRKVEKFEQVVGLLKATRRIHEQDVRGFKIVAQTRPFNNASHMKEQFGLKASFVEAFKNYHQPYGFLKELRKIEALQETHYYKAFIDIDYKTLNKHGYPVSGGERSEFHLLHEISDALQYEALLVDEPESSFDNIFLKTAVNEHLKYIATLIPVIIVTHNSTVGASIQPDWMVYAQKEVTANGVEYRVFSGHPTDRQLTSACGATVNNYKVLMGCLEAGDDAYQDRRQKIYEILKN